MKFTLNFLNCLLLGVIAFLSCARTTRSVGHDSNIGICQDVIWNRSAPLMTKVVHKNNNRMFKMFRKIELTLRFPEVRRIVDSCSLLMHAIEGKIYLIRIPQTCNLIHLINFFPQSF